MKSKLSFDFQTNSESDPEKFVPTAINEQQDNIVIAGKDMLASAQAFADGDVMKMYLTPCKAQPWDTMGLEIRVDAKFRAIEGEDYAYEGTAMIRKNGKVVAQLPATCTWIHSLSHGDASL